MLNQINLKGVMYAFGTLSQIVDASGSYVVGRKYVVSTNGLWTGDATKIGTAYSATVIKWDATADQITDLQNQLNAEIAARESGDAANATAIAAEITARGVAIAAETLARTNADTALQNAIDGEISARSQQDIALSVRIGEEELARQVGDQTLQTAIDALDVAYKVADATNLTTVNNSIAALATALRDERVTDFVGVDYTAAQNVALPSILTVKAGETVIRDGIHMFKFQGDTAQSEAVLSGLPASAADLVISYNDIVKVVVDGGAAVSATLVNDALKAKFDAVDVSIADLQAATTATAIRSHFSATGFVTLVNGVINASLSTEGGNDIKISLLDGKPYMSVGNTSIQYLDDTQTIGDSNVNTVVNDIYAKIGLLNAATVGAESGTEVVAGKVVLGSDINRDTVIGGAYNLDLMTNRVRMNYQEFACWTSKPDGTRDVPSTTDFVGLWFDLQGGANYVLPN